MIIINDVEYKVSDLLQLGADHYQNQCQNRWVWVNPDTGEICAVCLLGAVITGIILANGKTPRPVDFEWDAVMQIPDMHERVKYGATEAHLARVLEIANDHDSASFKDAIKWLKEQGL